MVEPNKNKKYLVTLKFLGLNSESIIKWIQMEEVCEIYIKRAILDKFALINQNIYAMETDLNAF